MNRRPKIGAIVCVTWDDAHCIPEEHGADQLQGESLFRTYGVLLKADDTAVWVAAEEVDGDRYRFTTRIPRGIIRSIQELRHARR